MNKSSDLTPIALAVKAAVLGIGLAQGAAHAATVQVTSNSDDGTGGCTLREAVLSINSANVMGGCLRAGQFGSNDFISFNASLVNDTIILDGERITITKNLTMDASSINGITVDANRRSPVFFIRYANVVLNDITITGGSSAGRGGAIELRTSNVTLNNSDVTNSRGTSGGAIVSYTSKLAINDSIISGNTATDTANGFGGGIAMLSNNNIVFSTLTLTDSQLINNTATDGGAVRAESSTVNFTRAGFTANVATNEGGAIYLRRSKLDSNSSDISQNSAPTGGAIHAYQGELTLTKDSLNNNSATNGGAIYINNSPGGFSQGTITTISLINSTISNNTAGTDGGGIMIDKASISITNSRLRDNSAAFDGGAIYATDRSSLSVLNSTLTGNSAIAGGAIEVRHSSMAEIEDSTLSNNSATFGGAFIANNESYGSFKESTISDNHANYGGGIYAGNESMVNTVNSTFSANSANFGGALLTGSSSSADLLNTTIAFNLGANGSGVFAGNLSNIDLKNSIVSNSQSTDCGINGGTVTSDTATIMQNLGNCVTNALVTNPQLTRLADNGGNTLTHALRASSPARNRGILGHAFGNCTVRDQRNQLRDDGDGACDVGAIEFNPNDEGGVLIVIPLANDKAVIIPN